MFTKTVPLNRWHGGSKALPTSGRTEKHLDPPDNWSQLLHLVTILTMLSHLPSVAQAHSTLWCLANYFFSFIGGSTEEIKKMLDINVLALSICSMQAFQSMKERGVDDGHIIHINRLDSLWCLSFVLSVTYFAHYLVFWSEQSYLEKDVPVLRSKAGSHLLYMTH
jgi:hypothetical protein